MKRFLYRWGIMRQVLFVLTTIVSVDVNAQRIGLGYEYLVTNNQHKLGSFAISGSIERKGHVFGILVGHSLRSIEGADNALLIGIDYYRYLNISRSETVKPKVGGVARFITGEFNSLESDFLTTLGAHGCYKKFMTTYSLSTGVDFSLGNFVIPVSISFGLYSTFADTETTGWACNEVKSKYQYEDTSNGRGLNIQIAFQYRLK